MRTRFSAAVALLALSLAGGAAFAQAPGGPPPGMGGGGPPGAGPGGPPGGGRGGGGFVISTTMLVESNSFPDGGIIPAKNSMQGGVQPDFKITGIPATAQSVVLIFHDIEIVSGGASGIDDNLHWMVWNIPVTNGTAILEEGKLPEGATGKGSRGAAYMGPGAPAGVRYHHYVFDFFAINTKLDLPATAGRPELTEALRGKIVGKASYVGRFKGEAGAGGGAPRGGGPPGAGGFPGGGAGGPPGGPGAPGGAPRVF
jgi:Raf kinase inhibitor-like YbhB/YbcL family protein